MLAQSHTPYILLACTIFDVGTVTHTLYFVSMYIYLMLARSNTPYILLACTIFDVGTVKHTLYFVSMYYI